MAMDKKAIFTGFLIVSLLFGLAFIFNTHFGVAQVAQTATSISGVLNSDTTWTQAGSPYILTGNVLVPSGVTLTIQAGAILNLNTYYIEVNGTLNATGTISNLINIYGGSTAGDLGNPFVALNPSGITFYGSGDIEYASVNSQISIYSSDVEVAYTYGANILVLDGSPLITNNSQCGISVTWNSPTISNNYITGGLDVIDGAPIISNNNITGSISADGEFMQINDNIIYGSILCGLTHTVLIEGNLVVNTNIDGAGIYLSGTEPEQIPQGTITIENNTFADSYYGVDVSFYGYQLVNTFYLNLAFNNFENITGYNLYWYSKINLNATLNYWGTTNEQVINQSIYDSENDFNLGTVSFVPYLSYPNSQAPTVSAFPSPTPTPSPSPSPIVTTTPTLSPSPSFSPNVTPTFSSSPSLAPTQQPTLEPAQTPSLSPTIAEFPLTTLFIVLLAMTILAGILFRKRKGEL